MIKGFIYYKEKRIPFVIEKFEMELFTDDPVICEFTKEYNFQTDYVLTGECFYGGVTSRKITINVERSMGTTCYIICFLISQINHYNQFDAITFKSTLLDSIFRYKYNYLDIARAGGNLSAGIKEVYCIPFSIASKPYELKYIIGHRQQLGLLESFEMAGRTVVSVNSTDIKECYKIVVLLERFMKFISKSSDTYFQRITFTDGEITAGFFYCKSVSEGVPLEMDMSYYNFDVMKYAPKIIANLAKELGNRITESMTLGHIGNYITMFTPLRFIEQIIAFEYLFEKLEPQKANQRDFYLVDELELMFNYFPNVIARDIKNAREVACDIKRLRIDIVHGHVYYYDFSSNHRIKYYMLKLDELIENMNLRLAGFNDEEIKNFRLY